MTPEQIRAIEKRVSETPAGQPLPDFGGAPVLALIAEVRKLTTDVEYIRGQLVKIDNVLVVGGYDGLNPRPPADALAAVLALTPDQRLDLFAKFCDDCGSDDPLCRCSK